MGGYAAQRRPVTHRKCVCVCVVVGAGVGCDDFVCGRGVRLHKAVSRFAIKTSSQFAQRQSRHFCWEETPAGAAAVGQQRQVQTNIGTSERESSNSNEASCGEPDTEAGLGTTLRKGGGSICAHLHCRVVGGLSPGRREPPDPSANPRARPRRPASRHRRRGRRRRRPSWAPPPSSAPPSWAAAGPSCSRRP